MQCEVFPFGALGGYRFVVVLSRMNGRILLSRHRARSTWETQGGHIEPGEAPLEAARRELFEESGALDYDIRPAFDYRYGLGVGAAFIADIRALGDMPESEMAEVRLFDRLPGELTYPEITPVLFAKAGIPGGAEMPG